MFFTFGKGVKKRSIIPPTMSLTTEHYETILKDYSHPYPLVRSGGLFLILIGAGIVADVAINSAFVAGTVLAVISLIFAKQLSFGRPTRLQIIALAGAILLEAGLLILISRLLPEGTAAQVRSMWVLIIVGVHFLPMALCFGPRFGILGLLCMINGLTGLYLSQVPADLFLVTDGSLKLGFGLWLLKG